MWPGHWPSSALPLLRYLDCLPFLGGKGPRDTRTTRPRPFLQPRPGHSPGWTLFWDPLPSSHCLPLLGVGSKVLGLDISPGKPLALCHRLTVILQRNPCLSTSSDTQARCLGWTIARASLFSPADGSHESRTTNDLCSKQIPALCYKTLPCNPSGHRTLQDAEVLLPQHPDPILRAFAQTVFAVRNTHAQPMLMQKVILSGTSLSEAVGKP